jgi:hypothetical protein
MNPVKRRHMPLPGRRIRQLGIRTPRQRLNPPRPPQSRFNNFLRKRARWLIMTVVAIIIAALVQFRDIVFGELLAQDVVGDEVRQHLGESALQVVSVEKTQLEDEFMIFALPNEYHLSPHDENIVEDIFDPRSDAILKKVQEGSLSPGKSTWTIYLRGQRNQGIRILDIDVVDLMREPPFAGTLIHIPPQGAEDSEVMAVDLDQPSPIVRSARIVGSEVQFGGPYFPIKTIPLDDKGEVVILLRSVTESNTVSFRLKVEYQVANSRESVTVDDNGEPFRLTAFNCRAGRLDYKSYYSLDGGQEDTTYGVYPIPPNDFSACQFQQSSPPTGPALPQQVQPFFVGNWGGHNKGATIKEDGTANFTYRDYSGEHAGDKNFFVEADAIVRSDGDTMLGEVTRSNSSLLTPGTPVRLERGQSSFEMQVTIGPDEFVVCNGTETPGTCGA